MKQMNEAQQFQALWVRGVERAAEEQSHVDELAPINLNEISGFLVRSSLKAGAPPGKPTAQHSLCSLYCAKGC